TEAQAAGTAPSPSMGRMHDELEKLGWKLAELVPRRYWMRDSLTAKFITKWRISPRPQPRFIESGSFIHHTVFKRIKADSSYRLPKLRARVCDENGRQFDWTSLIN